MGLPPSFPPASASPREAEGARPGAKTAITVGNAQQRPAGETKYLPVTPVGGSSPEASLPPTYPHQSATPPAHSPHQNTTPPAHPQEVNPSIPPAKLGRTRTRHPVRRFFLILLFVILVAALVIVFWGLFLVARVDNQIGRVDALSGAANTPGTTWLIAGSDSREGLVNDGTEGQRSDSIILVHQAANGKAAVVSLPRDTYTQIPGKGAAKLNAAFSWGGPTLLVQSVEGLTGLTVDHYVQVGMSGVSEIVDGLGGINLCWDQTFHDRMTGFGWEAGCHDVDGNAALLFSRMRYADPRGDIGRTDRQRLVISQVLHKSLSPDVILSPPKQVALADAGSSALTVDRDMKALDIAKLVLAMRQASSDGLQGVPPISSLGYNPGHGVGSTVLLDPDKIEGFFAALREGTLTPSDFQTQPS